MDYCKLNMGVTLIVGVVLDVVSLLEQISIAQCTKYVVIDLVDALFLSQSVRNQKQYIFKRKVQYKQSCPRTVSLLPSVTI